MLTLFFIILSIGGMAAGGAGLIASAVASTDDQSSLVNGR